MSHDACSILHVYQSPYIGFSCCFLFLLKCSDSATIRSPMSNMSHFICFICHLFLSHSRAPCCIPLHSHCPLPPSTVAMRHRRRHCRAVVPQLPSTATVHSCCAPLPPPLPMPSSISATIAVQRLLLLVYHQK